MQIDRGRIQASALILLALGVTLYFSVAFGQQAWRARQLQAQVNERQQQLTTLQHEHDALAAELAQYSGPQYRSYVEQTARRELGLAYPGETVVIVHWQDTATPTPTPIAGPSSSPNTTSPNWRRWLELFHLPMP
ncbi:FtsB family cell division protein [Thermorudis peleae]|uniref:FtsB family cell division protein n=1 Tax=Thermorudis peleae TaxID=1382356 RepID=UPI00056EE3E5|nr:septum formation initiator family protein [Thermorudis peleae]MBX6754363.1 septum formation initiator family protein [Thermorudis peleae]